MIIVEDTTNPSSKATCINSLLMWLREDVQRTAWIANAAPVWASQAPSERLMNDIRRLRELLQTALATVDEVPGAEEVAAA